MLNSKQRATLRRAANGMEAILQIGKSGVNGQVSAQAEAAIVARELIKIRVLDNAPVSVREAAETLARQVGADVVQVIGTRAVLFRKNNKETRFPL